jgi:hypothetical protein
MLRHIPRVLLLGLMVHFLLPTHSAAQQLLVIPNLSEGANPLDSGAVIRKLRKKRSITAADSAVEIAAATTRYNDTWVFDPDFVGAMDSLTSQRFWGEARSGILPGANLGLGSDNAAIYTELGHVLSGSWRVAVGTTISATDTDSDSTETERNPSLDRFIAGGGSLSIQALRPLFLFEWWDMNRGAIILAPRAWVNIPTLSSADGVDDYGGELGVAAIYQRQNNANQPFLTAEMRFGWVAGSNAFYAGIGDADASNFVYWAPSLTLSVIDQVNIGVSTFLNSDLVETPSLRVNLTLLNKKKQ